MCCGSYRHFAKWGKPVLPFAMPKQNSQKLYIIINFSLRDLYFYFYKKNIYIKKKKLLSYCIQFNNRMIHEGYITVTYINYAYYAYL